MGQGFLLNRYLALGKDTIAASLGQILRTDHRGDHYGPMTTKDVYRAFLDNAPVVDAPKVHDLFRRFHGGPLTDDPLAVVDDHGDTPETATGISNGALFSGELEHAFDTDFFRFNFQAGRNYPIEFRSLSITRP